MKPLRAGLMALALCVLTALCGEARAEVFHSRESALRLAFPGADTVDKRELFLSSEDAAAAEQAARTKLQSRLVTVYVGRKGERILGYAFIETHKVRSLPETVLVVIEPDGRTRALHMLAFHEPPEYAPSPRWLEQFEGRPLDDHLSLRGDIDAITGATLTANALTASVRRLLAVFDAAIGVEVSAGESPGSGAPVSSSE